MHRTHKIRVSVLALLATLVFAIAGCTAAAPAATVSSEEAGMDAVAAKGGDLVLAFPASSEPASLDGHIDPYQTAWLFDSFVSDPLVILDSNGEYQPALATSWSSNEEGTSWTFELRDDVMFQDGTSFNAEAVKFNIERILAPETASAQMANDVGPIESVEVVDEFTIQLNYGEPWVTVLDVARRMPIWSPTAAAEYSLADFDKHLVGTGPFTLEEWVPNDRIVFAKWEDYGGWNSIMNREGPAYLDSVTVNFIGESAVLGSVVLTGDADVTRELPSAYIEDYKEQEEFEFVTGYQAGTGLQMIFNTRNAPLSIPEVRMALNYGTDQTAINDLLYDGTYLESFGPVNVVHPCHWDGASDMYGFDPDKAAELLAAAGYADGDGDGVLEASGVEGVEDGTPLSLRWSVLHHEEIGEAVQSQWRQLGIDLQVEKVPGPVQLERVNARDFDIIYERQRSPDPMILDMIWNSRWDEPGGWAWTGFADEELDSVVGQLRSVSDNDARCTLAEQAQQIILENAVMLPTLSQPVFYAMNAKVKDFQLASEGNYFFIHNTYIEE